MPAPKHNSQVGKSDTELVEQSVKPINTQNKPAVERPGDSIVSKNTEVKANPDTSILLDNRHKPNSPAITYYVSNEIATNSPISIQQIHNMDVAPQNATQQSAIQHLVTNKAINSVKRVDKHIIENSEVTKTSKMSKTAKLNYNKFNTKTNCLAQPKLKQIQESTNRANRSKLEHNNLPQTGEKGSNLIAMLGLVISSLGLVGTMKSKKRKDN